MADKREHDTLPILYSLQHCPYAMRARMGLILAPQPVMLRAVVTKNKPDEMMSASPKGTVPVLVLIDGTVIDESLDIMLWALRRSDPGNMLMQEDERALPTMLALVHRSDNHFKPVLEQYKKAKRKRDPEEAVYRRQCETFVAELELALSRHEFLMGANASLVDYALLPFIRQFARVDRHWYLQSPYPHLRQWLDRHLQQPMFSKVMAKYPLWLDCREAFLFAATGIKGVSCLPGRDRHSV